MLFPATRLIADTLNLRADVRETAKRYGEQCAEYIASNETLCSKSHEAILQSRVLLARLADPA
jgi:hypothetical protein